MPDTKDPKDQKPPEGAGGEKPPTKSEPLVYKTWLDEQPKEVQTLLTENTTGLKSALDAERESRKGLEKDMRSLAEKADGDIKEALEGMAGKIESADQKTAFYEDAHAAGVTNIKLAYLAAKSDDMFDRRGNVNFDTLQTEYPELFAGKAKIPKGGAGDGHDNSNAPAADFDAAIRKAAGYG